MSVPGFSHNKDFFSLIPKEIHARIYNEIPPMSILFPYEISASDISHVRLDYYSIIRPIPYGIITFMYFSKCINQWVAVEVNRFHKISTVWAVNAPIENTHSVDVRFIYMGIHVFKENEPPLFVEIRKSLYSKSSFANTNTNANTTSNANTNKKWPYPWTHPVELPITTSVCAELLDITLQSPYPIYHFQYVATDPDIPDTVIRVRDIIDSEKEEIAPIKPKGPGTNTSHIEDGRIEIFRVRAGSEWDTFYLFVLDGKELVYYAPMYIQNLEQSIQWNAIFRSVQTPDSFDWIEKCEKEHRQKNRPGRKCTVDNYRRIDTELVKTVKCRYHSAFGHWVPIEPMPGTCRPLKRVDL
jgi:hypothetical protein